MNAITRFFLGLEDNEVLSAGESHWELSGMPQGVWMLFATLIAVGAIALIVILYRREHGLGPMRRAILSATRIAAFALVILVLLNPRIITELHNKRPGRCFVVLDTSGSMAQRDAFRGAELDDVESATGLDLADKPTRMDLVRASLQKHEIIERLEEKNDVVIYSLDEELSRIPKLDAPGALAPTGERSAIGDALAALSRESGDDPVAGVVLITDGRNNAGPFPLELILDPARWRGMPIHAVGAGLVEDTKNRAVVDLIAPDAVEIGYPIQIEGVVRTSGLPGAVEATLMRIKTKGDGTGGGSEIVEKRTLQSNGSVRETRLRFVDSVDEKGTYYYRLQLDAHPDETTRRDNRREVKLIAADEKRRVLLVTDLPSPLFDYVSRFFIRDDGIQVSIWHATKERPHIQDGDVPIRKLPGSSRELETYDLIVLIDPSEDTLSLAFVDALVEFVGQEGGGLVYVAGESFTPKIARNRSLRAFHALLPVSLDATAPLLGSNVFYADAWRPALTDFGKEHPIGRLDNEQRMNEELWEKLSPFYFVHPSRILRPSARALMRSPGEAVVGAIHRAGFGEVIYFGSDDFWRWNASGQPHLERFFAGVVRYLALGKLRQGERTITMETDRDRYKEGDQVRVVLRATGGKRALDASRLEVFVEEIDAPGAPGGAAAESGEGASEAGAEPTVKRWRVALFPDADERASRSRVRQERYAGIFRATRAGRFRVLYDDEERLDFEVEPVSSEWQDPSPDFAMLEELAARTGGGFLPLKDIDKLPDRIPDGSVTEIIGRRATTVWDSAVLMILFGALLTLEWALRKLWHLN